MKIFFETQKKTSFFELKVFFNPTKLIKRKILNKKTSQTCNG